MIGDAPFIDCLGVGDMHLLFVGMVRGGLKMFLYGFKKITK